MLWFYRRAEEQIACEIRIAFDGRAYELHILHPDGTRTVERYGDFRYAVGPAAADDLTNKPRYQQAWAATSKRRRGRGPGGERAHRLDRRRA